MTSTGSKIFNDKERRAASLRQLSFLSGTAPEIWNKHLLNRLIIIVIILIIIIIITSLNFQRSFVSGVVLQKETEKYALHVQQFCQ